MRYVTVPNAPVPSTRRFPIRRRIATGRIGPVRMARFRSRHAGAQRRVLRPHGRLARPRLAASGRGFEHIRRARSPPGGARSAPRSTAAPLLRAARVPGLGLAASVWARRAACGFPHTFERRPVSARVCKGQICRECGQPADHCALAGRSAPRQNWPRGSRTPTAQACAAPSMPA